MKPASHKPSAATLYWDNKVVMSLYPPGVILLLSDSENFRPMFKPFDLLLVLNNYAKAEFEVMHLRTKNILKLRFSVRYDSSLGTSFLEDVVVFSKPSSSIETSSSSLDD